MHEKYSIETYRTVMHFQNNYQLPNVTCTFRTPGIVFNFPKITPYHAAAYLPTRLGCSFIGERGISILSTLEGQKIFGVGGNKGA